MCASCNNEDTCITCVDNGKVGPNCECPDGTFHNGEDCVPC